MLAKGTLQLVCCRGCAMVYADPVDPELASGRFYDRLGVPFYLSPDKLAGDYAPVRFAREQRLFRRFCPAGRVLDVGCSTGAFLFQLKSAGDYQVLGMDVTSAALEHAASQGVAVLPGSFLELGNAAGPFAAITFWAVMEHLLEPRKFLAKAADLLEPGGHCFILVPNWRSLATRLLGVRYRYLMPDHVNYFSPATLRALIATEARFQLVTLRSTHFNPAVIWQDWRRPADRVPDAARARLLKQTTALKQNRWLIPLRWAYRGAEHCLGAARLADNLVVVLRRNAEG